MKKRHCSTTSTASIANVSTSSVKSGNEGSLGLIDDHVITVPQCVAMGTSEDRFVVWKRHG